MYRYFLVWLCCFFWFSESFAENNCRQLFQKNQTSIETAEIVVLPPEVRLKPEAVRYLLTTAHAPLLRNLAKAFSADGLYMDFLPLALKHSVDITTKDLLPIPTPGMSLPFETDSEAFQRAFTVIQKLSMDFEEDHPTHHLDTETLLVLARLTEKIVPTTMPPDIYPTTFDKMWHQIHQIFPQLLKNRTHREAWLTLLENHFPLAHVVSKYNGTEYADKHSSLETFELIRNKFQKNHPLSKNEVAALGLLAFKTFSSLIERLDPSVDFQTANQPLRVNRQNLLSLLLKDVKRFVRDEKIFDVIEMFDLLFFRTPPPVSDVALRQQMYDTAQILLFRAKSDFGQWQKAQSLMPQSPTSSSLFAFQTQTPSPTSQAVPEAKVRIKTRGIARPTEEDESQSRNNTESKDSEIEIEDLALELQPDKIYTITFKRDHVHLGSNTQNFIFTEDVVAWFEKNPDLGQQFLKSIQQGPTTISSGQSGIKLLQQIPKTLSGRLYEVKIRAKYRMVLNLHDGLWTALSVVNKDHFDAHIRRW